MNTSETQIRHWDQLIPAGARSPNHLFVWHTIEAVLAPAIGKLLGSHWQVATDYAQDAWYVGSIEATQNTGERVRIYFANPAPLWSLRGEALLSAETLSQLQTLLSTFHLTYIPATQASQPYDGVLKRDDNSPTWHDRFFGYGV